MNRTGIVAAILAITLVGCGGGGSSSPPVAQPTATPAPTPPPPPTYSEEVARLKAALATGGAIQIGDIAVSVSSRLRESWIADAQFIEPDDERITMLGGRHTRASGYPYRETLLNQAVTTREPVYDDAGYTAARYGLNDGIEFVLPAGQSRIELVSIDGGTPGNLIIEIDGVRTNLAGYPSGQTFSGSWLYNLVEMPESQSARTVRVWLRNRAFGGLRLPAGETLGLRPDNTPASMVFIGDSISEGSNASHVVNTWPMHVAARLGIGNPIMASIGGTGYLQRRGQQFNFLDRSEDVLEAVTGGPPDAVVIAGGLNDCRSDGTGFTPQEMGDAAASYFAGLRSAAPDMVIFVLGPFSYNGGVPYPAHLAECRDAIFAAAAGVEGTYTIDVSGWLPSGDQSAFFNLAIDGVHPNDYGHSVYGEKAAAAMGEIIAGL